ncbi:MAG: pyrroline-5-carboxylate reductase [Phycisphaerae bacterium]|nr:MAG: pyrroline-5-carboxylate reductase [Phycisphaerae bacterium]
MTGLPALAIVGFGAMGRAIALGLLGRGFVTPGKMFVAEPDGGKRAEAASLGMTAVESPREAAEHLRAVESFPAARVVLVAVKPQLLDAVAESLQPVTRAWPYTAISILAGVTTERIEAALPGARVVRAMPNLGVRVGLGCTAVCAGRTARPDDIATARGVFGALGMCMDLSESLMDAFTAVAGSGPAYAFLLAEAMEQGAREVGFTPEQARTMVSQTLRAAAALLDGADPADLRRAVTSKGGTTEAALGVLDQAGVRDAFARAIIAARDRGHALNG